MKVTTRKKKLKTMNASPGDFEYFFLNSRSEFRPPKLKIQILVTEDIDKTSDLIMIIN